MHQYHGLARISHDPGYGWRTIDSVIALEPVPPDDLQPLAREILEALKAEPAAREIVLGGGTALQHYCNFRETRDLDAWWVKAPHPRTEDLLRATMNRVAHRHGYSLEIRKWGETQSYELREEGKTVFSFQIAVRDVQLEPPLPSVWDPVRIETFRDNLGAKMNALVGRGAPRDFLDVHEVCRRGLATVPDCWRTWSDKNPGRSVTEARANVVRHLELIESRRPLGTLKTEPDRSAARSIREWIKLSFCREDSNARGY